MTALVILRLQVLMPRTGAVLMALGTLDRVLTLIYFLVIVRLMMWLYGLFVVMSI